jgi:hypothetical protein
LTAALIAMATTGASADSAAEINALKAKIAALEEKTDLLVDETSDLKTGFNYTTVDSSKTIMGMGDAASKVYYSKSPLSIGGYGEMFWANPDNGDAFADVYRFVPYIGYKFSDNLILNTEIEFEHGDEMKVEFMYLDFLMDQSFNIRLGHLLVPMGLTNMRHEPTLFNTVQRPDIEKYLLPSTWHETGVLVYGELENSGFEYHAGLVNALDLSTAGNTGGNYKWIRDGRMGGHKATMESIAVVGRIDYTGINGLLAGVSAYYGDAAQGGVSGSDAFIYDLHASYELNGFKARGVYTATSVDGAENWGIADAATDASGYYVNVEYDVLANASSSYRLPVFVQHESYDPVEKTVDGTVYNQERDITTVGINYFPHEQVVLKLDYAMTSYDDPAAQDVDTVSFGLGFLF